MYPKIRIPLADFLSFFLKAYLVLYTNTLNCNRSVNIRSKLASNEEKTRHIKDIPYSSCEQKTLLESCLQNKEL